MAPTVNAAVASKPVPTQDGYRRPALHAGLKSRTGSTALDSSPTESMAVQVSPLDRLTSIVESSLLDAHGSQKAAAIEVGCDQSQLKRQIKLGTFDLRQCSAAGAVFLAALGAALLDEYGSARKSKRQIALERLPELLALMIAATTEE